MYLGPQQSRGITEQQIELHEGCAEKAPAITMEGPSERERRRDSRLGKTVCDLLSEQQTHSHSFHINLHSSIGKKSVELNPTAP